MVFGLSPAIVGPFDLTETWLIVAYVLMTMLFALGPIEGNGFRQVTEAANAGRDRCSVSELMAALHHRRRPSLTLISVVLYGQSFFVMVTKPF